ncbi:MAG: hypothetical protein ACE5KQ_06105 [Thermoplasmata archaeon]
MSKMWAWDPSKEWKVRGRNETELARYFKLEHGEAEVDRLLAEAHHAVRRSFPGRFLARLRPRAGKQRENGRRNSGVQGHPQGARL